MTTAARSAFLERVDYMTLADRGWPLLQRLIRAHVIIYRASRGVVGHRLPGWSQILLLDHLGAKSNVKRTTPLLYAVDDEDIVIVASKGGYPKNPAWYHNLLAHLDTTVQIRAERRPVHARFGHKGGARATVAARGCRLLQL